MATTTDPVMALMGWHGEPLLLRRLKFHVAEAVLEISSIAVCMYLSTESLQPKGLFVRLLCLPLAVTTLNPAAGMGYLRLKRADVSTALRRMGCLQTRSHWSCSVAMFTCFSCLLMVWHTIVLLLMFCYEYNVQQAFAVRFLMASSGLFMVLNWAFWRDFVRNYRDTQDDEGLDFVGIYKLQILCKMYKTKVIRSRKVSELQQTQELCCAVCLEDFEASETVAQLPCGHCFHPPCINKWVLEDWRCPFRCALEMPRMKVPHAWMPNQEHRADAVDLEAGQAGADTAQTGQQPAGQV
eukprot:CAMPEP_0181535364 /NCGR_PEP_ID=MMETSP1110-20121109/74217_1 /TAXON_ID=174948 /ORGANISM="Symbiodinium sp., Strain CCMP421" /LENGTH=295 /DNA_ID=CAMNT_0023666741 /DNA_START=66 /DNA_END=954 /DNA_ORIENTATION=-